MRIPHKILRKMRYYTETQKRVIGTSAASIQSIFTIVTPWYLRNVVYAVDWEYTGQDENDSDVWRFVPSPMIKEIRRQLDDWIELQNQKEQESKDHAVYKTTSYSNDT